VSRPGRLRPAWPVVALIGSYELLMTVIRSSQVPAGGMPETGHDADPLQEWAAETFAGQLAADRVPSVRAIRAQLHVGQPRAQMASTARRFPSAVVASRSNRSAVMRSRSRTLLPVVMMYVPFSGAHGLLLRSPDARRRPGNRRPMQTGGP
jgi:hypothetical protein